MNLENNMQKVGPGEDDIQQTEAVTRRCSLKKVALEISQNSLENTYARVSFLIKLQAEAFNFIKKGTSA